MSIKYITIIVVIFILLFTGIFLGKVKSVIPQEQEITFEKESTTFRCENGVEFDITYSTDKQKIRLKSDAQNFDLILNKEISATGIKYSANGFTFFNKDNQAFIEKDGEMDGEIIINNCIIYNPENQNQMSVSRTGELAERVVVSAPLPNSRIKSPLVIKGLAPGNWFFEASAPVVLTDWDGRIIAQSYITSEDDWMTTKQVPFSGVIEFTVDPEVYSDRGALILQRDNPSGLPEHDSAVEIPIYFEK